MGDNMNALEYFKIFTTIPRESGNEKEISNYLVRFAKENNLEYYQDEYYNVIIKRKSNNGSNRTIILQGHIDMVCVSNTQYDFKSNKIEYIIDGNIMHANGTSLGADNGIGCSIILAILSDKTLQVPNIEAVFTVSEETNMLGAIKLDYQKLTGKELISIDGTDEGVIEVSSAGMSSITLKEDSVLVDNDLNTYQINISGLLGGHSGVDIDKGHGNAIKILMDILSSLNNCNINYISGGVRDNVIPNEVMCIISTDDEINVDNYTYPQYKDLKITIKEIDKCAKVLNSEQSSRLINFIHTLPINVLTYKNSYPQTSLNLATINVDNEQIKINISIRSNNKEEEKLYVDKILNNAYGFSGVINSTIPFFEFNPNSSLRDLLVEKYKELYKKDVLLKDVHAGLEGGVFKENLKDLDIVVIAPNLYDIHTTNERVEIDSVIRVYNWLVEVLKEI